MAVEQGTEVEVVVWNRADDNLHVIAGPPGTLGDVTSVPLYTD